MKGKIKKILIANRGEIASRIIRTCWKLKIETVAIYSNPDADKPFVKEADKSIPLDGFEAKDTYLNIEKIIHIAKQEGVDAIHPGYGFLSENPIFAQQVREAGIIFIGPSPEAIQKMGDKVLAKKIMKELGVPVIEGYEGENQNPEYLLEMAKQIGFPVMIKASAGGGGKGMRKVENESEFFSYLESAKREAKNFFMNDHVFLEKFISLPRHIEVQIFGDKHGNYVHFFERDCSIQRRNQKVIEEAPAVSLSHNVKNKIYEAALKAVRGIQYENAGTVEFIVDENENFYFLEMNTRLQVEHPVTEEITGYDLVELQIRVAEGGNLPSQNRIHLTGHSIELRVYAEENDIPSSGIIYAHKFPQAIFRVDSGIQNGVYISTYYDSMLAKLIVKEKDRKSCINKLIVYLETSYIHGIPNNLYYLKRILEHPEFQAGNVNTKFIENFINNEYLGDPSPIEEIVAKAHIFFGRKIISNFQTIFSDFKIWGDVSDDHSKSKVLFDKKLTKGFYHVAGKDFLVERLSYQDITQFKVTNLKTKGFQYVRSYAGFDTRDSWNFTQVGYKMYISYKAKSYLIESLSLSQRASAESEGAFRSPMPGKVISILTKEGEMVKEGSPILVIEAMKMENTIFAPENLIVEKIFVKIGDLVTPETQLIQVKPYLDE